MDSDVHVSHEAHGISCHCKRKGAKTKRGGGIKPMCLPMYIVDDGLVKRERTCKLEGSNVVYECGMHEVDREPRELYEGSKGTRESMA